MFVKYMLLHKIRIIPTAVRVTKPKQNLGKKSLRHLKTNKILFKTNKIPAISLEIRFSRLIYCISYGLYRCVQEYRRENVWICNKKTSSRNDNLLPFVFIL